MSDSVRVDVALPGYGALGPPVTEARFLTADEIAEAAENLPPPAAQVETLVIPPLDYYRIVLAMVKSGAMDRWEGWRLAFNAGFRAADLLAIAVS